VIHVEHVLNQANGLNAPAITAFAPSAMTRLAPCAIASSPDAQYG